MKNPWEEISLSDYENHMKLDSVMQLQAMNEMMKGQFNAYSVTNIMILGIAGGKRQCLKLIIVQSRLWNMCYLMGKNFGGEFPHYFC